MDPEERGFPRPEDMAYILGALDALFRFVSTPKNWILMGIMLTALLAGCWWYFWDGGAVAIIVSLVALCLALVVFVCTRGINLTGAPF